MENKKLNVKMIYTVIGIASLTAAFVCVVVLAVKQYRLWKSGQMYEKLAESTTVPSTTMPLEGDMDEGTTQELEGYKREAARLITKYGIDVPEKNIDFIKRYLRIYMHGYIYRIHILIILYFSTLLTTAIILNITLTEARAIRDVYILRIIMPRIFQTRIRLYMVTICVIQQCFRICICMRMRNSLKTTDTCIYIRRIWYMFTRYLRHIRQIMPTSF